jgi:NitT/TauT family transport system permease protein/sulfonate transport system permease protein
MWSKLQPLIIKLIFLLLSFLVWQGITLYWVTIPGPIKVFHDITLLLQSGIVYDILLSIWRVIVAMTISFIIGVSLGLLSARVRFLNLLMNATLIPLIEALPPLAWTIICVLIIGMSDASVFLIVSIILIQFFVVNTIEGLKNIDRNIVEMARSFPLGQISSPDKMSFVYNMRIMGYVELSMIIPYLFTAIRLAYGVAWKVIVVAEMFGASQGIGYLINQAYSTLSITRLLSLSALIVIFFLLGDYLVLRKVESRFRKWYGST